MGLYYKTFSKLERLSLPDTIIPTGNSRSPGLHMITVRLQDSKYSTVTVLFFTAVKSFCCPGLFLAVKIVEVL